jgi:hypothetical protein
VRSASLADLRMCICYQNNGGSNISKRENSELWRDYFPNCARVSLGEQQILIKFLSIDSCENYVVPRGVQQNPFSKHLLDAHPTAYYNEGDDVTSLLAEYTRENSRRDNYMNILVNMYEAEIQTLKGDINPSQLTEQHKATIKSEMRLLEDICDKNIIGSSILESSGNINPMLFKAILVAFSEKCPFAFEMIEFLVISNPCSKSTTF